jgi:hypothetical protein
MRQLIRLEAAFVGLAQRRVLFNRRPVHPVIATA